MTTRMLGKAGQRRVHVGRGRCSCIECQIVPSNHQQRARERRAWGKEAMRTEEEDVD